MDALILFNSFNYPVLSEYNGYFLDIVAKIAIKHNLICFAGSGDVTSDSGISRSTKAAPGFVITSPNGKKTSPLPKDSKHKGNSFTASNGSLSGSMNSNCYSRDCMRRILIGDREQFNSVIQLILAPYVASVRVYKEKCNMSNLLFETIKTTRIYFTEYLDHIILHIGDSSGAEVKHARKAQRKIHYFTEILKFTFGSNLSTAKIDDRQSALAISLYRTWISSQTSPVYLIEVSTCYLFLLNCIFNKWLGFGCKAVPCVHSSASCDLIILNLNFALEYLNRQLNVFSCHILSNQHLQ